MSARRSAIRLLLGGAPFLAALSGCGASAPPAARAGRATARVSQRLADELTTARVPQRLADELARAERTHEVPTPAPPERATGSVSAVQEINAFAGIYINWNAKSVAAQMSELALASVGQARSEMALAAAQTGRDSQLRQGGVANRGTVEAVAPLPGQHDRYVVVTRESTSAANTTAYQGLAPAWHVTIATVLELAPGRWVVSDWQPES